MLEVVLIRPGATDFDAEGRIQGTLDIPLNAEGQSEVERLIRELQGRGIELLYAPECEPAHETAQAIGRALGLRVKRLDDLRNLDHGLWQGMRVDEVKRKQPKVYRQWQDQPECVCPPQGETVGDARSRVARVLDRLFKKHPEGTIGLVAPEPMASLLRQALVEGDLGDLWQASAEHGRYETLRVGNGAAARLP